MSDERYENFDRITDVLSPFTGYSKIDPVILDRAAHRGTRVHQAIDNIIQKTEDPFLEIADLSGYIASFRIFWNEFSPEPLEREKRYFDELNNLTGQVDLIALIKDKKCLIDWKTSSSWNRTWPMQGSAYSYLLKQHHHVDDVIFVKLDKKGKKPDIHLYDPDAHIEDFSKCLWVYREFFKNQPTITLED